MREIKFRAWNPDSKKMTYVPNDGGYLHLGHKSGFISPLNWYVCNDKESTAYSDRSVLMQFTGLLDKNGKEIYEGNIVKIKQRYYGDTMVNESNEEVIFEEGQFTTKAWGESLAQECLNGTVEIIGNIYQNPELSTVANAKAK